MLDTIYILRHGFRLNLVNINWKSATGLPRDAPLAAYGVTQAQELADYFLTLPIERRPTAIFSSPYYRCLQTASPVAAALGVPIFVEHGIAEWYSPVTPGTGLHPRPSTAESLRAHFPKIDADGWSSVWIPPRKGEDVDEVHERASSFLQIFIPTVEQRWPHTHERILLMSHAAVVIALTRALVQDRELPLRAGCCSLTELVRVEHARKPLDGWKARRLADGRHLKDGTARDWGFEDIQISDGKVVYDPGEPGTENEQDDNFGPQIPSFISRARY